MPKEETEEIRHVRSVIGEKTDLPRMNPRVSLVSRIRSLLLKASNVSQLIHTYGVLEPNKVITLNEGEDAINCLYSDGLNLYVGIEQNKIIKIDLTTFTRVATLTLDSNVSAVETIVSDGSYLYAGVSIIINGDPHGYIYKIDISSFTVVDSIDFGVSQGSVVSQVIDGTYLYALCDMEPVLKRVRLDTFSYVDEINFGAGYSYPIDLAFDGMYLYVVFNDTPPSPLVKVDVSTFTISDTVQVFDDTSSFARCIYILGDYIYVGAAKYAGGTTYKSAVYRVDRSTFSPVDNIDFVGTETFSIVSDGTYLYAGVDDFPNTGKIAVVDVVSFQLAGVIDTGIGPTDWVKATHTDGTYLYAGFDMSPGVITRTYLYPAEPYSIKEITHLYEQIHSANHYVYPALSDGVTLTAGTPAWTKGSYAEIVPANTIKTTFYLTGVVIDDTASSKYEIDIATGGAGSESNIYTVAVPAGFTGVLSITPPIKIPSRTRVAGRCATSSGVADTCTVKMLYKV